MEEGCACTDEAFLLQRVIDGIHHAQILRRSLTRQHPTEGEVPTDFAESIIVDLLAALNNALGILV